MKKLVVLASGRGSNFQAIVEACQKKQINAEVTGLVCNRPQAEALSRAKAIGVPSFVVDSQNFKSPAFDRKRFEQALLAVIEPLQPDFICLAGYMLLLGPTLLDHFAGKIINIHPSLLPAFKGLHAQRQALAAGAAETGCTVHWVTPEMDSGEIIEQSKLAIEKTDTEDSLTERLLEVEHATYVAALKRLCLAE